MNEDDKQEKTYNPNPNAEEKEKRIDPVRPIRKIYEKHELG